MERSILHCDINNCYASIEQQYNPKLRGLPIIVGGDAEARHGIVLAKSEEAKKCGVKTAETLIEARAKCPDALIVPPNYDLYLDVCKRVRNIFSQYTDRVEPFGLDEAWLDVTDSQDLFGDGTQIAEQIRHRVKAELGITVSAGVSYNKVFAKLGSDMHKPDAVTTIPRDRYKQIIWPLPAGEMLYVGRATQVKLRARNINTIGDLANVSPSSLRSWFGKMGVILHCYANGEDLSPVAETGDERIIKSIGHSTTTPRDLICDQDCKIVLIMLAECVAERMREQGFKARTVQISLRGNDLLWFERQMKLLVPSNLTDDLVEAGMTLLKKNYDFSRNRPLRSIGIRATDLLPDDCAIQTTIFTSEEKRARLERLEATIDDIRGQYGHYAIARAVTSLDKSLRHINPKDEHGIQITGFTR